MRLTTTTCSALLALAMLASCDEAAFQGDSKTAAKKKAAAEDTKGDSSGNSGDPADGDKPTIGDSSSIEAPADDGKAGVNGSDLNPNASGSDPTGLGAAFDTEGDADKPFAGGKDDLLPNPPGPPKMVGGTPGLTSVSTEKQAEAVKNCLQLWGWHHPFAANRTAPDKVIFGNLEIGPANRLIDGFLGTEFSGITDTEVTAKPSLILIFASVNLAATDFVLPTLTYKLMNPKGWYCVSFAVDLASHLRVELKKGAKLADSRFSLDILSDKSKQLGKANISVLSKTEIVTVP